MTSLRIHPAIGIARVGSSDDYFLGPETMAGMPQKGSNLTGGLPIQKGTDSTPINSEYLRDEDGKLKRQAARFKIFQYTSGGYPSDAGTEVTIGSTVDGKKVADIVWTVHLANKKANCWINDESPTGGLMAYENGGLPPLRNLKFSAPSDPADETRLRKLVIDAGPRAVSTRSGASVRFDQATVCSYAKDAMVTLLPEYPKSFPASAGPGTGYDPASQRIDYLGEITTEKNGRLLVLGGHGKACGFDNEGSSDPHAALPHDVNNDNWLDDTSDGPVTAVLIFEDRSSMAIEGSAWVVATDPDYAPQVQNAVSLWDDVYTTWVEKLGLQPDLFKDNKYQDGYSPCFADDVFPLLRASVLQRWATNLPEHAVNMHDKMDRLDESPPPFDVLSFIRKPNDAKDPGGEKGAPLMPLSLGDTGQSFISVTTSQYFFLEQWAKGKCVNAKPLPLGPGELLDKAVLFNCLGGRFSPGIDLTFIVRDVNLYDHQDWQNPAIGPFRINMEQLDYSKANKNAPFLGVGYTPLRPAPVQPGDLCKFMALPWHTDYNSCATHLPSPNPGGKFDPENPFNGVNTSLFWSWPAQRPVAVYTYADVSANAGKLPSAQRYSVRGEGTETSDAAEVGRYQDRRDILLNWGRIGVVLQGPAISNYPQGYNPDYYLEVQSQFEQDDSNLVQPWPNTATDKTYPPKG